jgi:hypothetical protein
LPSCLRRKICICCMVPLRSWQLFVRQEIPRPSWTTDFHTVFTESTVKLILGHMNHIHTLKSKLYYYYYYYYPIYVREPVKWVEKQTGFERATKERQQCLIPQPITGSVFFSAGTVWFVPTLPDLPDVPGDSFSSCPLQLTGSCSGSDHLVGHSKGMK